MVWKKIALVGVGLLGGSLGLALRKSGLAGRVEGYVRRAESVAECQGLGVVDEASTDLPEVVDGADLAVLCTPIGQMRELATRMAPMLQAGAIVTDVGSVKAPVVRELEPIIARNRARFVGSHPMAGAEKMGVRAARPDLFANAVCVITPGPATARESVQAVERFWASVGARPLQLPPELHDELVGRSSHLPHVLAAQLANSVLAPEHPMEQRLLCANGFRDTTRIASGSPEMWRDIALANRANLVDAISAFIAELSEFQNQLERGDGEAVEAFFERARGRRNQWCGQHSSPSPE
jgi:prephenate dehydrogenase